VKHYFSGKRAWGMLNWQQGCLKERVLRGAYEEVGRSQGGEGARELVGGV